MRQVIDDAADALAAAGVGSPRVDAELLAAHTAGADRWRLAFVDPDHEFLTRFRELVARRAERIPLQHLTGTAAFGPVSVQVGPGVFVPRPETESLLEWALSQSFSSSPVIVDLCTGSGALALGLAHAFPQARIVAVDDSAEALAYARRNAQGTSVELRCADATADGVLADLDGTVDLLVSNPPYIPLGAELEPEVAQHDPVHALFGGADGMAVIDLIAGVAARLLRPHGLCAIEHDDTTSDRTVDAFERVGGFTHVTPRHDLAGRPRFVTAVRAG
ncbi:peptide chain release factor N(5)-glutamine methyltransferase [Mycobacterium sp. 236(2023)]|uniref:peptide chain release factor N(5)-glutamine methyltransferase n=1 Tax=Mycobacterium sp. 236(2023) TaxID=3038163 RepID=UPI0024150B6B|nr:peptide chain release factor N(5)-glutamine methyltransferase [Mycobacterium sp. 236(2023)]MDG4669442.1 peptide chain release factor N(5)-glutamine methyltransferase [Mycobacterium sp. 236(2023)]